MDSDIDDFPPPRAAGTGISDSDRDHSQHYVASDVHSAAGDSEFAGSSSENEVDTEAQGDEEDDDESDADSMIDDFLLLDPNQPDDPIRRVFAPAAEPVSDKDLELENSRLRNIVDNMAAELESRRERLRV